MIEETMKLREAVDGYLDACSNKVNDVDRKELSNFIRWFGADNSVSNLKENNVADYSESLSPSDTDYRERVDAVKKFIKFSENKGWIDKGLVGKVKIKKSKSVHVNARRREEKKIPITREGYDAMVKELEELKTKRLQVIEDIRKAAADKDLKENAPYHAAREQKSHLDGRIMDIEETIKVAEIVEEMQNTGHKINVGNTVKLHDLDTGEYFTYTLVSPREVNPSKNRISNLSPIGKAIIGHNQGDTVEIMVPAGKLHYRVEQVDRQ